MAVKMIDVIEKKLEEKYRSGYLDGYQEGLDRAFEIFQMTFQGKEPDDSKSIIERSVDGLFVNKEEKNGTTRDRKEG